MQSNLFSLPASGPLPRPLPQGPPHGVGIVSSHCGKIGCTSKALHLNRRRPSAITSGSSESQVADETEGQAIDKSEG
jgi:hypothetical protein